MRRKSNYSSPGSTNWATASATRAWKIQSEIHPQVFGCPPLALHRQLRLEQRIGPLPLSLRAFYEVVGEVNFVGDIPDAWHDWRSVPDSLDAIYVYPAAVALEEATSWQEEYGDITEEEWDLPGKDEDDLCDARAYYALPHDCWLVPIAPDEWHKYGISGCGGYDIAIPSPTADARLLTERHRTTFVNYLRICFRWAGFSGLQKIPGAPNAVIAVSEHPRPPADLTCLAAPFLR